jgi:alpha/beta superfamily hydrolase
MPEVIFTGPEGRLEGRYHHSETPRAPIAVILHPHPQHGGTMNNKVVYNLYYVFVKKGFSVVRFNFRGVGRSQGDFDNGQGELSDAASALDWLQSVNANASSCWVAGFSFGAWIGMQLLMRRPEIEGFVSIAPPANMYDFSFLAPCPSSGLILQGTEDDVVPEPSVEKLANKLKMQKNITIDYQLVKGANHFFKDHMDQLVTSVNSYVDARMGTTANTAARRKAAAGVQAS